MLNVPAPFPFPGSTALLNGICFSVFRHNGDGTAVLMRDGERASFTRTAEIVDLVDPAEAAENARLAFVDAGEATRRIGLWIARHLRDQNDVSFHTLFADTEKAASAGRIPALKDRVHLSRILRQLGWRKDPARFGTYQRGAQERAVA